MKKIIVLSAILLGASLAKPAAAQIRFGLSINVGAQPAWGPAGYDYADYYYLPDIGVYYCIPDRRFIYLSGGQWVYSPYLPSWCRNYDLYRGYKVVINQPYPYLHNDYYSRTYGGYRGVYDRQVALRDQGARYGYGYGREAPDSRRVAYARASGWDNDRGGSYGRRQDRGRGRGRW